MRGSTISRLLGGLLAGAVLLAGCGGAPAGGADQNPDPTDQAADRQEPPLEIPASFESAEAKQAFAIEAVRDGHYEEAAPLLEESVQERPSAEAFARLGTARYNTGDYDGAIAAWSKAAELDPARAGEMKNNIGNALRDSRRKAEAEAAYREALELEPTRWTAAVNLATMLWLQDRLPEAVAVLESAVATNPDLPHLARLLKSYQEKME